MTYLKTPWKVVNWYTTDWYFRAVLFVFIPTVLTVCRLIKFIHLLCNKPPEMSFLKNGMILCTASFCCICCGVPWGSMWTGDWRGKTLLTNMIALLQIVPDGALALETSIRSPFSIVKMIFLCVVLYPLEGIKACCTIFLHDNRCMCS